MLLLFDTKALKGKNAMDHGHNAWPLGYTLYFIDYEKAFNEVQHDKLMDILKGLIIDRKDIRRMKNLCWRQTAQVHGNDVRRNYIPTSKEIYSPF